MIETGVSDVQDRTALLVRSFGWCMMAALLAYVVNTVGVIRYDLPGAGAEGFVPQLQLGLYVILIVGGIYWVAETPWRTLRQDAEVMTSFNTWFIRGCFFAVFFVGVVDAALSFMRVEGMLVGVFGEEMERAIARPAWRGANVHIPVMAFGFVLAFFSRSLAFPWLALLIVAAELGIVITRFVFSYEQAFMADLVRFWYAALFLFASAYTLIEDGHVRVDVLYAGMGPTTKGMINAVGSVLLGITLCWTIIIIGMGAKTSIINAPLANFEITQSGVGMYVKYLMAGFLGVFAISMLVQFTSYLLESVADWRDEPGRRDRSGAAGH